MHRHGLWGLAALLVLILVLSSPAMGADPEGPIWTPISERSIAPQGRREIIPQDYRTFALNQAALAARLALAPLEGAADQATVNLPIPMPDGTLTWFSILESPIMAPELAARYPEIKTYIGQGLDDPTATMRFDWTPQGFHAMILSANGTIFVDPYSRSDTTNYISYFERDFTTDKRIIDQVISDGLSRPDTDGQLTSSGSSLRTYRLAMAATGEYTSFHGGTVQNALAAIVTTMNRVNGVYEREVAVRMVLINNTDLLIYTNGATDPYTNNSGSTMLSENQTNITNVIGAANYDIGHVFSTGGGGIASLGSVCLNSFKARGVTGSSSPVGDAFDVDYVAHEIGHQFGANHTFNGTTGACAGGNRNGPTAYEPGSGSTIMAYAGICGAENLQPNSDDYFHGASFDEMRAFITSGAGNTCGVLTSTGNSAPLAEAGPSYTIPASTPFTLTGSATDPNGHPLTYHWEEFDLGAAGPPNTDDGSRPIFRSFSPTTSPSRTFPRLSDILNNTSSFGESLPTTNRTMQFRLTARDNRAGGGGVGFDTTSVTVVSSAGPFVVTAPNTAVTWGGGTQQTVTWNVAGTSAAPVSCANVRIELSTNGGQTFTQTVLASTPNDGSQTITVPNTASTTARIRVSCVNNIFFDLSNLNFTINAAPSVTIAAGTPPAEPNTNGNFTLTLSAAAPSGGLTVNYSVATGGSAATLGVDYIALSGSITIPQGATTAQIPITVLNDSLVDPNETISLTLISGNGYILGATTQASLTIGDDDLPRVTIAAGTPPAEPATNGNFTVTSNAAAPSGGLIVNYSVATGGSAATPDADYVALSGSVIIPQGATTAQIPVTVLNDGLVDPNETIRLTLTSGSGYTLGATTQATMTIGDDDVPSVTIVAGMPPAEPGTNGSFTITLDIAAPSGGLTVNYTVATGGSAATPGVDYVALSGSVVVPEGETTAQIPVTVLDDGDLDPNETIQVTLDTGSGYNLGTSDQASLTIGDDDSPTVTIAAGDTPAEPSTNGSFLVTLSTAAPSGGLTVNYMVATGGSAATPGVDYVALSGTIVVPEGETTAQIPVAVLDDGLVDPNETIGLTLTSGSSYNLGTSDQASLTIGDDDLPTVTIAAGDTPAEPETDGSFLVTLSTAAPSGGLIVNYSVATGGNAATPGVDYVALSGTIVVPEGTTTVSIPVVVIADAIFDPDETVTITLSSGTNYTVGTSNSATLTIEEFYRIYMPLIE